MPQIIGTPNLGRFAVQCCRRAVCAQQKGRPSMPQVSPLKRMFWAIAARLIV
jgi:hypothetical protein